MLSDPLNWVQMSVRIKYPGCADNNFTHFWILRLYESQRAEVNVSKALKQM